jgi:hypothetical protein
MIVLASCATAPADRRVMSGAATAIFLSICPSQSGSAG